MVALAFLPWFRAVTPGERATASGVSASGEVWSLPLLGAIAIAGGVLLVVLGAPAGSTTARRVGVVALLAGVLGAFWAIKNGVDVPVRASPLAVPPGVAIDVPVEREPAVFGSAAAAACAALAGVLAMRPELRR
jgi:hypothetical protein